MRIKWKSIPYKKRWMNKMRMYIKSIEGCALLLNIRMYITDVVYNEFG